MKGFIERNGWPKILIVLGCGLCSASIVTLATVYFRLPRWAATIVALVMGVQAAQVGFALFKRLSQR